MFNGKFDKGAILNISTLKCDIGIVMAETVAMMHYLFTLTILNRPRRFHKTR